MRNFCIVINMVLDISDCVLSSILGEKDSSDISRERIDMFEDINAGLSRRKVADRFCIPYRIMETWWSKKNPIPCRIHIKIMLGRLLRVLQPPFFEVE